MQATTGNVVLVTEAAHAVLRYCLPLLACSSFFSFHLLLSNLAGLFDQMSKNLPLPPPKNIVLVAGTTHAVLSNRGEEPSEPSTEPSSSSSKVVLVALRPSTVLRDMLRISCP